jgi:Tol biopolymer transport system component
MLKKIIPGIAVLLLVFASLACALSEPKSSPAQLSGRIIYQSDRYGNTELFSVNVRTGKLLQLTGNSANDNYPAYIAATRQIGFVSDRLNGWNFYVMDAKGRQPEAITHKQDLRIEYPKWSRDGKYIAASLAEGCTVTATVCNYDIYVINADGTNFENLTHTTASEFVPEWSPDGQHIAFESDRDGDYEIYVMDRDGSNLVQLTHNTGFDGFPRFSPDGTELAFTTDREGGDWDIFIMNADGSDARPVTQNITSEYDESWSPDGNWLVYVSVSDGDDEIFIIDINGQNQRRLTHNAFKDAAPIWIP